MPRLQNDRFCKQGPAISFQMDGESYDAVAGESIAAALIAGGRLEFRRDKSGAPRGPLCGMGVCLDCEVSVDGGPPQRACLTKARPGMVVRSLEFRVPPAQQQCEAGQQESLQCDVMVVGAGPAGLTAAAQLAESGLHVVVADERPEAGGQFFKQLASSYSFNDSVPADRQYRDGRALIDRLRSSGAHLISGATVWGVARDARGDLELSLTVAHRPMVVQARQVVLATGAFESVPAFAGWTLPGVMTTGAAQGLVRSYRVAPGQRVLIAGNGPLNLQLASELLEGGATVVAVAESAPHPFPRRLLAAVGTFINSPGLTLRGFGYLSTLRKHRVPLLFGHHIASATGEQRVLHATIAQLGAGADFLPDTEKRYEVDAVCVGYALQPSNELARLLGCTHDTVAPGVMAPVRDGNGQTSVVGVYVIGDGGTVGGAHVAMAEGRLAASAICASLASRTADGNPRDRRLLNRHRRFQRHLWSLYKAASHVATSPDVLLCRCELVTVGELRGLIERGTRDLDTLKRLTRAGMGPCQGRYCQKQICTLLAEMSGSAPVSQLRSTPRLPIKPALIATIAAEKPEWYGYRTVEMPAPARIANPGARSLQTHVLVVGAGIIGVATALYLARAGVEVTIVDRGVANAEASGSNAGSLHLQLLSWDLPVDSGADAAAVQTLSLQKMGIAIWLELEREIGANFELQITGGIVVAQTEQDLEFLGKKAALERSFGIDVETLSKADLQRMVPAISTGMIGGTYCSGEGKINPMLATPVLLQEALKAGARFEPNVAVLDIDRGGGKYRVATSDGTIDCRKIVNATGGWSADIAAMVGARLPVNRAPQQMIVTEATSIKVDYLLALARRHLTMKQAPNGNLIIGGGWTAGYDPELGKAVTLRESIEGNLWVAQRVIPDIGALRMIRSWATIGVMIDGAPILGELPGMPGFFNAVGANGYTMGPILGKITAELAATGKHIADIRPFCVERFN